MQVSNLYSSRADGSGRVRKLRWKCRRGMKELDILLDAFMTAHEQGLRSGDWPELERLLEFEDDQLWDCLRQPENSPGQELTLLVEAIRSARDPGH